MTKIEAIEKTIYNLENDVYEYKWTNPESCNCGILAKTLLSGKNLEAAGFHHSPKDNKRLSPFCREAFCITTNLTLPEVFKSLKDAGFSIQELVELENLSNPVICSRLGLVIFPHGNYYTCLKRTDKSTVIDYLKEWLKILKEPAQGSVAELEVKEVMKERIKYVSVPETIKESVPENSMS